MEHYWIMNLLLMGFQCYDDDIVKKGMCSVFRVPCSVFEKFEEFERFEVEEVQCVQCYRSGFRVPRSVSEVFERFEVEEVQCVQCSVFRIRLPSILTI